MAVGWGGDRLCQTRLIPRSPDGDKKRHQLAPRMVIFVLDPNSSTHTIITVPVNQLTTRYGTCDFNLYSTAQLLKRGGEAGVLASTPCSKMLLQTCKSFSA